MTPQEQLCEKMRVEQSAYCLWLTAQPPEEILHHAYEYSVREDIILATEEMNLTPAQVRALLKSPAPLADVYKDFSKLETDYMSIVAQCVEARADDLLKKIGAETIGDVADYLNKNESENSSADDVLSTALLKICYENMDMDGKMVFWEDMLENNSLEWRDVE